MSAQHSHSPFILNCPPEENNNPDPLLAKERLVKDDQTAKMRTCPKAHFLAIRLIWKYNVFDLQKGTWQTL